MSTGAALLDLSRRATDAVLSLGIMAFDMPGGIAIAVWAPGQPWHGQPEGRTGEDIDAWALLDDVVAGKAVFDLRDPLTRAGALPLLVRQAHGEPLTALYYGGVGLWYIVRADAGQGICMLPGTGARSEEGAWLLLEWAATQRKEQA